MEPVVCFPTLHVLARKRKQTYQLNQRIRVRVRMRDVRNRSRGECLIFVDCASAILRRQLSSALLKKSDVTGVERLLANFIKTR